MRVFRDEAGTEWMVWAVRPSRDLDARLAARRDRHLPPDATGAGRAPDHVVERRRVIERRLDPAPDPVIERRRGAERRQAAVPRDPGGEDRRARRGVGSMPLVLATGWLAFQAGTVRRRLAPIPEGWSARSDAELARLCRQAAPVTSALTAVQRVHGDWPP